MWLLETAYYRVPRKAYVEEFIKAALIASHANLLANRPRAALQVLAHARHAAEHIGAERGSDHFRQRGVALFQLGAKTDAMAEKAFVKAEEQMERLGEARHPAQVLMTGTRHISLLGKPNWEESQRVLKAAESTFAPESLEISMCRHWTAACGLLIDSNENRYSTFELLQQNAEAAKQFGHQATIAKLLSITPDLGLPRGLQVIWIRKALYQNAFRFR